MQESPKDENAEDQKERGYYYDDAHGYEEYDPEEEEDDAEMGRRGDGVEPDAEKGRRGDAAMRALFH
jgi:hypothetical protein